LTAALAACLLAGAAHGSGMAGAAMSGADGMPLPGRKPAALQLASLPPLDEALPPRPARKPQRLAATAAPETPPPLPGRKPQRTPERPLSTADAALYRQIFEQQARGAWDAADALTARLAEDHLRGHTLYQRYMHPAYDTTFAELQGWLARYADLPGADRIHRLAESRRPAGDKTALRRPATTFAGVRGQLDIIGDSSPTYSAAATRTRAQQRTVAALFRTVRKDVAAGAPTRALRRLDHDEAVKYMDTVEIDQLMATIAGGYMYQDKLKKAYDIATAAARRSGSNVPMAGWTGGLAAWRLGRYDEAARLFEDVAASPFTSGWMSAAGAYWASRAHMRAGNTGEVSRWLRLAATQPRTFYGLIATRALGWDFDFNWDMPELTAARRARLEAIPAARRAMALVAAGQNHLAEEELNSINPGSDSSLRKALLAYAHHAGLPPVAMRLAESTGAPDGGLYDAALYPLSPWQPEDGYKIDRALLHAIVRQESRFDPAAQSGSGATGLMQLMPATASFVDGNRHFRGEDGRHMLRDPETNLAIGQRYIADLLEQDVVQTDLFALAIAYNAGPGNLRRWKEKFSDMQGDPLLFVESIPVSETRAFVERVLANYWIYRTRMNQPTPSLAAVASGEYARYVSIDDQPARAPARPRWAFLRFAFN
jgi:soluble lytic murein transglycosylase-like protein